MCGDLNQVFSQELNSWHILKMKCAKGSAQMNNLKGDWI